MQRSHSFGLLANNAPEDEIRRSITPAIREDLETALSAVMRESAPAPDVDVMAAVTSVVSLIGQDWDPVRRDEFLASATLMLMDYPGGLVLDALHRAKRHVTIGRILVCWVADDVEPKAEKLKIERERLSRLAELAQLSI